MPFHPNTKKPQRIRCGFFIFLIISNQILQLRLIGKLKCFGSYLSSTQISPLTIFHWNGNERLMPRSVIV